MSLFNGLLLINKDRDCSSHQVVHEIRKILNQRSIGHAGTLDPLAKGLLIILCGSATKLSSYFINQNKRYNLSLKFGLQTDTFDLEGKVLNSKEVSLKPEDIKKVLKQNTCDLEIPVPIFSAVKVKGRKLYSYAFKDQKIDLPLKKMSFWDLEIHDIKKDSARLSISCSKGSYIRAWVNHLGQNIKTGACLTELTRVSSGDFELKNSLTLSELKQKVSQQFPTDENRLKQILEESFLFSNSALSQFSQIELTERNAKILKQGNLPDYILSQLEKDQIAVNKKGQAQILKVVKAQKLLALLEIKPFEKIKILRNFPY
ncbi:MAG: tRNA pseudouridine(55) synthase TruB [Bdellovibrionaceae bacterium]|nr:tRNA pseudouridine(55) synthase TruB [Pseudobdellovibrionaceae bacterium]